MNTPLDYASELVSFDSVSSRSNCEVSDWVQRKLRAIGFDVEWHEFVDALDVRKANVVGKLGTGTGGVAFFGHTDVVPASTWKFTEHGPFTPTVKDDRLFGRGSCDMKGSVACMISAAEQIDASELNQPVYIVCTADEEVGFGGALQLSESSEYYREMVTHTTRAIIGEPTLLEVVHAHKGVFGFTATARGVAAHSSTDDGINANLAMIPFLHEMKAIHDELQTDPAWQNDAFTPPTVSWNIGINDHTSAVNITPPQSICSVYLRPMPGTNTQALIDRARAAAELHGLEFVQTVCGVPVWVDADSDFVRDMLTLTGREEPQTVAYATDGCALPELKQMIVCGPGSIAQAHTQDEWIALDQLELGTDLFRRVIEHWCV